MQEALKAVGFTEAMIAEKIMEGIDSLKPSRPKLAYIETGARLLDAFPAEKHLVAETTVEDLIKAQESPTHQS